MRDRDLLLATPRARRRADSRLPVTSRVTNPLRFQGGLLELRRSAHLPGRASLIAWCSFAPPSPGFIPLRGIGPVTCDQHARSIFPSRQPPKDVNWPLRSIVFEHQHTRSLVVFGIVLDYNRVRQTVNGVADAYLIGGKLLVTVDRDSKFAPHCESAYSFQRPAHLLVELTSKYLPARIVVPCPTTAMHGTDVLG